MRRISSDLKIRKQAEAYSLMEPEGRLTEEELVEEAGLERKLKRLRGKLEKLRGVCPGHPHCECGKNQVIKAVSDSCNQVAERLNEFYDKRTKPRHESRTSWLAALTAARNAKIKPLKQYAPSK